MENNTDIYDYDINDYEISDDLNLDTLDSFYRAKPGINLFSKTIQEKRAELKKNLLFKEVMADLFMVLKRDVKIGSTTFSPEMMWRKHHIDIVFKTLRGYRNDFQKNWDIFTAEEQVILQNFIDRSLEYEREWKVDHDYSIRCPYFPDMDKVLQEFGGLVG
jgi:hypothetical protein